MKKSKRVITISKKDMLDTNKIKMIDNIAGAERNTDVEMLFRKHGISYSRYASTNKL